MERPASWLKVHPDNPRYFADETGRAVLLAGSHTWTVLQDAGREWPPPAFDYEGWLDRLQALGHQFFRMWTWEHARWVAHDTTDFWFDPLPYRRTGPGDALDGRPRFDLRQFDERYLQRLRSRVEAAGSRGIYCAVMLFHGWSIEPKTYALAAGLNPWRGHPLHRENNVNGIDGDPAGADHGLLTHTLAIPEVIDLQRRYLRHVAETLAGVPNVLYEVSNEDAASAENDAWQDWVVTTIRAEEIALGARPHVAMRTVSWPAPPSLDALFASPAEAISPNSPSRHGTGLEDYCLDPPPADGRKVVVADTDHLWGVGGDADWVWRTFTRGHNPVFMDPWEGDFVAVGAYDTRARDALGVAARLADRLDLAGLEPRIGFASSRFALVARDLSLAVVYCPVDYEVTVDLRDVAGAVAVEWLHPVSGLGRPGVPLAGGSFALLRPPFAGGSVAVLTMATRS